MKKSGFRLDKPKKIYSLGIVCAMIASVAFSVTSVLAENSTIKLTDVDINKDGAANLLDACTLHRGMQLGFSDDASTNADVNKDGAVDDKDLDILKQYIVSDDKQSDIQQEGEQKPVVSDEKEQVNTDNEESKQDTQNVDESKDTASNLDMNQIQQKIVESEPADSTTQKAGVTYGTMEKKTFMSDVCKRNKNMNILLPANYDTNKKYPVLYVLHGFWGDENSMTDAGDGSLKLGNIIGNAISEGEAKDMIVVFPDIYASATQEKCSAMDANNVAAYNNFVNVLIKEIMPYMEKNYPIKTGKNNTAITGFSMGGMEALSIGMEHNDMFGYVGGMCPAPGLNVSSLAKGGESLNLLMISGGSNDTVVSNIPGSYHDELVSKNVTHVWHYVNGGAHGGNTIRPHMYNFVRYIFK